MGSSARSWSQGALTLKRDLAGDANVRSQWTLKRLARLQTLLQMRITRNSRGISLLVRRGRRKQDTPDFQSVA
ncbi:MAG: hypothetical protein ACO1RT_21210 [Planctomycetaceae bacterium]